MSTHARVTSWAPLVQAASALVLVASTSAVAGEPPQAAGHDAAHPAGSVTQHVATSGVVAQASVTRVPTGPIVVPAGMPLVVELAANLNTRTARVGDRVEARLAHDLVVLDDRVAASAGARVTGTVTEVASRSPATGDEPALVLTFDSLVARNGATLPIKARYRQQGSVAYGSDATLAGGDIQLRAGTVVDATMETTLSIY